MISSWTKHFALKFTICAFNTTILLTAIILLYRTNDDIYTKKYDNLFNGMQWIKNYTN